jgi:hypothetical protein
MGDKAARKRRSYNLEIDVNLPARNPNFCTIFGVNYFKIDVICLPGLQISVRFLGATILK